MLHGVFESEGKNGLVYRSCQGLIAPRESLGTKIWLKGQNMAVFHKDPCGVICLLMTYSAVLYADYCLVQHVIIPTLTDRLVSEFFTAFKGETFHGLSISIECNQTTWKVLPSLLQRWSRGNVWRRSFKSENKSLLWSLILKILLS